MDDNFLLTTDTARTLYWETARDLPLIDYHNHLAVGDLAEDRRFDSIAQLWLTSDPYKHRAMRICGVDEALITGGGGEREKFRAWCAVCPKLAGGPLYDWSRLELRDILGIETPLRPENADRIWDQAQEKLSDPACSARGLLRQFRVEYAAPCCALTDDLAPFGDLPELAPSLRGDDLLRPDRALFARLEALTGTAVRDFSTLEQALGRRLGDFSAAGCRFSDHALDCGFCYVPDDGRREERLQRVLSGEALTEAERAALSSDMLRLLGSAYARMGWTMQLHLGAVRYTSTRLRQAAGAAGGFAAIGSVDILTLVRLLDDLDQGPGGLPRTILYNLDPADNAAAAVLSGSFPGVTQGPAWWWCDHLQGMRDMLDRFAAFSVLYTFPGMTTDSRSLLSLLRHDYFRRCFCGWAGEQVSRGVLPGDMDILKPLTEAVCYKNAKKMWKGEKAQ